MLLRSRLGMTLGTGVAIFLAACGGGGSTPPVAPSNKPPSTPVITGPSTTIQKHPSVFALSASDPESDPITFTSTTSGVVITGATLTYAAPDAGPQTLSVIAQDSKGAASAVGLLNVQVTANGAPVFTSPASVQFTNAGSGNPPTYTYQPAATDPQGDEVVFSLVPASVEQAVDQAGQQGVFQPGSDSLVSVANPGATSTTFGVSSTLPPGAIGTRTRFRIRGQDRLPGSAVLLGGQTDFQLQMTVLGQNFPPVITSFSPPSVRVNHPSAPLQLNATDVNNDLLQWSLAAVQPATAGISLSAAGLLAWNPVADTLTRSVTVKVVDGRGGEATRTFDWTPQPDHVPVFEPPPAFTQTVGGVALHEPALQKSLIFKRERFHYSDPLATDAEFAVGPYPLTPTGWRAYLLASDIDLDPVRFAIKPGSVFRFGVPFTDTANPSYPRIDAGTGEITWQPGRTTAAAGGDALNTPAEPANWAFTVTAQQLVGGQPTPGYATDIALSIRVLPNDPPRIGPLEEFISNSTENYGVLVGGGSSTGAPGRPAQLDLQSSDTETPGSPARWAWQVQGPGTPAAAVTDYSIWDANTNAASGHMDAVQVDFGNRTLAADGRVTGPLTGLEAGRHYPLGDSSGNNPGFLTGASIPAGFFNPWIQGPTSPGLFVVAWAPVRSQYQLDRYLGGGRYAFPITAEDQYAQASVREQPVGPVFGTIRMLDHRFHFRADGFGDSYSPKGNFLATGNTQTGSNAYVLSYLPEGFSSAPARQEMLAGSPTFGAHLFGSGVAGKGAPASGYVLNLGVASSTAGNWFTLDGSRNGLAGLYPANPLNEQFHPAAHAAGRPATLAGGTESLSQWKTSAGGTPQRLNRSIAGPYADGLVLARSVPSNSAFLFHVPIIARPSSGDGLNVARQWGVPSFANHWLFGRTQSEIDFHATLAGRPVLLPQLSVSSADVEELTAAFTSWSALRVTFSWPLTVSQTAAGYPASGAANAFQETDIIQVATPNLSGNARFFVTGNTPGVTPPGFDRSLANYFGKLGFTVPPTSWSGAGAVKTLPPHQPIHAVTDSLWIPNSADGRNALPNAYTTPVGGGQFCDIPWAGIRGYLAPSAAATLNQLWAASELNPNLNRRPWSQLAVAIGAGNLSPTGLAEDAHANPALLDTPNQKDRVFFLWMKQAAGGTVNAYGAWGGSVLTQGATTEILGGSTVISVPLSMNQSLSNPFAILQFAAPDGRSNQPLGGGTGLKVWRRSAFEALKDVMGAPAGSGRPARVRVADPASDASVSGAGTTSAQFDAGLSTFDAMPSNSLVVYALKDRSKLTGGGALGEAGLEPGSPILAQWWNTGSSDIGEGAFPGVLRSWARDWLPADFTEVVHLNHGFVGRVQFPGHVGTDLIAKLVLQSGLIAPRGHPLLTQDSGLGPVVTPVRQLQVADLKVNSATGSLVLGTRLDLFLGNAANPATGEGMETYKLEDGNATGTDHRLSAYSTWLLSFQPSAADPRPPSGYVVQIYQVTEAGSNPARTSLALRREVRMAHTGGIGTVQRLFLPGFQSLAPAVSGRNQSFVVKVRSVWMEGDEGPSANTFDLAKAPYAVRFPMAYADALSGVFVVAY